MKPQPKLCPGGRSLNLRRFDHAPGSPVICYRCGARLGCERCAERPDEVICRVCNNYGTMQGIRKHGNVQPCPGVAKVIIDDKADAAAAASELIGKLATGKGIN